MKRIQKRLIPILAAIAVTIAVVAVIICLSNRKTNLPVIQDAGGLNTVASELDKTNLDTVDQELNQLDLDISNF